MTPLVPLCTIDRDFVRVVDRALEFTGISPTLTPDPGRSTHYIVQVPEEDVDRACAALHEYGTFIPSPEETHVE